MNGISQKIRQAVHITEQDEKNLKGKSLTTSAVRKISQESFQQVKNQPKDEIFHLCEELLETKHWEERTIAFDWAFRLRKKYSAQDFDRFESWLEKYVHGWGSCDDFCTHAIGYLIYAFPEKIANVKTWIPSENRWFRRGAAVVMIYSLRRQKGFEAAFEIADQLLMDEDDLVQKGSGWMLKEISKSEPLQVFEFVMQRKAVMPRTSLRYAIEKLSPELRQRAMEKPK
jgi:3-methyladenine DNA glycosylase AlkD